MGELGFDEAANCSSAVRCVPLIQSINVPGEKTKKYAVIKLKVCGTCITPKDLVPASTGTVTVLCTL